MTQLLSDFLATEGFHPHGFCYLWRPGLIWLHVVSDALIGFAYVGIGLTLAYFVRQGSGDIPFSRIFVAFGVFIVACGATHFMEIWTLWNPVYWLAGSVKVVTAAASVLTAVVLPPLVPLAVGTIRSARVSDRRREELEVANGRLTDAHQELNVLYARLKEADEAKTRFFANVSHELRTPLTLILGPTEKVLTGGGLKSGDRRNLESVRRNANLLLKHVNDLLDLQKVEAGQMHLRYVETDLTRTVRICAAHFESVAEERGIELSVDAPASVPAQVDPDKLTRVLLNLLSNAFKFTPSGGRVRCTVRVEGDASWREGASDGRIKIEVHDSGPGIPLHQRELVFEPFRQLEETPTGYRGGTGLGLAIVRNFVELHGGSVSIGDSPEGGALFLLDLPATAPSGTVVYDATEAGSRDAEESPYVPELDRTVAAIDSAHGDGEGDPAMPLVLVAEDNVDMNRFIVESLDPGYRVATAFDGRTAVEKARALVPDLILSDLMMPILGGDALVRELRSDPAMDSIPILLLTARADDELRIQLLREGAQDYLTKPFSVEELRARLDNWISISRTRTILQRELNSTLGDVEALAAEVGSRKRDLESALAATRLALSEAEGANRSKSDFLGVMSHELRTPLNAITGYLELLELEVAGPLTEAQRTQVRRAKVSSDHLLHLIDEVLTYARVEAGKELADPQDVDIGHVAREAAALLMPAAAAKGLELDVRIPDESIRVTTDAGKFRQILLNLIGNAVKFTDVGHVWLTLEARPSGVVLRVHDTGVGIADEHLENIFEPFWQVDASKSRRVEGTGLGLSITRSLIELLGGEIQVKSAIGRGTEVTVRLPAGPQADGM